MLDDSKIFFSYCLAVTAATLPFTMLIMLSGISHFESATTNSIETKIQHFIEMVIFIQFFAWLFVFLFAAIPFSIGIRISSGYGVHSRAFHVIGGTITAMVIGPLTSFLNLGFNVTEPLPSEGYQYLTLMPVFAPFGAIAGLTFWKFARLKKPQAVKRR